jgi:hypothetical protein
LLTFSEDFFMRVLRPELRRVALAGLALLPVLWLAQTWLTPRQAPQFRNVQELKAWAESRGLYWQSDWEDGRVTGGLALSTRPLTWEQVGGLCRTAPGEGAEWKEIVWAMNRPSGLDGTTAAPWDGECRVWGGILVTGDRRLLDRLESEGN